jgi:predicted nucleotidyltransferase component of viral defense system
VSHGLAPSEDLGCYASPNQRTLLGRCFATGLLDGFFLTGGTCLAVFYLHHRISRDLDIFTVEDRDLTEIAGPLGAALRPQRTIAAANGYWSGVVDDVRIDLVVDPLSSAGPRPTVSIDGTPVALDVLENIGPNKISALIARGAARDAVDCYLLYGSDPDRFRADYVTAVARDALLEDDLYARERLLLLAEDAEGIVATLASDLRLAIEPADLARALEALAAAVPQRPVG